MRLLPLRQAFSALAALCAACSAEPSIELTVTPSQIAGDGVSPVTVRAKITRGGSPAEGTVHITTSGGRIQEASGQGDPQAIDSTTSEGVATATILPPRRGRGAIEISVTSSLDGAALKQKSSVKLVPAGGLASSLEFSCAAHNIGALVTGRTTPIHVQCTAVAKDANGRAIPNASIETLAEAGALDWHADEQSGQQKLIYTVEPGAQPPKDVDPFDATGKASSTCSGACIADPASAGCVEPCWLDHGVIRNPRDGLATLVVAVPGVKAFDDRGEPFVDADDDGVRSAGENFIDSNDNGKYDGPDGTQKERLIWRAVRIVWSGEADTSATAHGSKFVKTGGTGLNAQLKLRLNDKNFNTLAAAGAANADQVDVSPTACDAGHALALTPASIDLNQSSPGIQLRPDLGSPQDIGGIDGAQFATTYRVGGEYLVNASIDEADRCDFTATVSRSYDPGAPGFEPEGDLSTEEVAGVIQF